MVKPLTKEKGRPTKRGLWAARRKKSGMSHDTNIFGDTKIFFRKIVLLRKNGAVHHPFDRPPCI
jgi:hypothetical protein